MPREFSLAASLRELTKISSAWFRRRREKKLGVGGFSKFWIHKNFCPNSLSIKTASIWIGFGFSTSKNSLRDFLIFLKVFLKVVFAFIISKLFFEVKMEFRNFTLITYHNSQFSKRFYFWQVPNLASIWRMGANMITIQLESRENHVR